MKSQSIVEASINKLLKVFDMLGRNIRKELNLHRAKAFGFDDDDFFTRLWLGNRWSGFHFRFSCRRI